MRIHFVRARLIGLVLAGGIALALWLQVKQVRQEQIRPLGSMTAAQAIARSEPICRAVMPDAKTVQLSTEYHSGDHPLWTVSFRDAGHGEGGYIDWDSETGEITSFGCREDDPLRPGQHGLSRQETLTQMRRWLACLRPELAESWQSVGSLKMAPIGNAMQRWEGHHMRAMTEIDYHSGALLMSRFWRLRQS